MDLALERVSHRLREPLRAAWGVVDRRELVLVRVREGGHEGVGEAAPLPGYDAPEGALDAVVAALQAVVGEPTPEAALAALPDGVPHARAALDMAAWDLRGRREGRPVAALLTTDPLPAVPVNALITAEDRAGASAQAAGFAREGFRCVKAKVGVGDDAGRLAAVRAAVGPDVAIRIDANAAWSLEEAVANLAALAPVGIELCEEPTGAPDQLPALRGCGVPLGLDETSTAGVFEGADAVCLRLGAHGGIAAVMDAGRAARAAGADVYLASTFDGPVGVAAALHVAAALRVTRPCGLATLRLLAGLDDPFPPRDGHIRVSQAAGLGIAGR